MTLDEMRPHIIEAMIPHVPFDGWSGKALAAAAKDLGIRAETAQLAFPGGAIDMVEAFIARADRRMEERLLQQNIRAMKVRDRFRTAILARLEDQNSYKEAVRHAAVVLVNPLNVARATRIAWRTADSIWHAMGDTSADFSYYSKRATAVAVYASTLLIWLDDESEDFTYTRVFLDHRVGDVMRFEKAKADLKESFGGERFHMTRFLGRLRYPVRY